MTIVQHETDVVFHRAKSLAGAVGGGVDHTGLFGGLRFNVAYNNSPEDFYDAGGSGAVKAGNMFIDPMMASPSTGNYRLQRSPPLMMKTLSGPRGSQPFFVWL